MAFYLKGFSSLDISDQKRYLKKLADIGKGSKSVEIRSDIYQTTINQGPGNGSLMTSEEWKSSFSDACLKAYGKRLMSKIMKPPKKK